MKILSIDATVNDDSRTRKLADCFLDSFRNEDIKEIDLTHECIPPLNKESLAHRFELAKNKDFDEPIFYYAKEYINADLIVIIAPFWDLSFPATLKTYIEAININGLTFAYDEEGNLTGNAKAKHLVYITTAGGKIQSDSFGFGYVKELAKVYHNIKNIHKIQAENLDIIGQDPDKIIENKKNEITKLAEKITKDYE